MLQLEQEIARGVTAALDEDLNYQGLEGDITAGLIDAKAEVSATIICREAAIMAGLPWVDEVYRQLDDSVELDWHVNDRQTIEPDTTLVTLKGPARTILTGERVALNFLQTLMGTATIVARYVSALSGSQTQLLDTRKTLPGLRAAQKYAVACGGGVNHRTGLFDAYLIKENHILACGNIANAVNLARQRHGDKTIEVEVESLDELNQALDAGADIIMLDNFELAQVKEAVEIAKGRAKLEVSGNITLERLHELAQTGVDYLSSGALTKHVEAIDLSMRVSAPS